MRAGAIEDYTFLWWDVRPHPNLGTVETRIFDQQTRVEHTIALAALIVCLAHRLCALYDDDEPLVEYPTRADRRQQDPRRRAAASTGVLIDFRAGEQVAGAARWPTTCSSCSATHADELGCRAELDGVEDLIVNGTGAHRQLAIVRAHGDDLRGLAAEIARDEPSPRRAGVNPRGGMARSPELSVVCKSCGSEVSPYVTECPYCGTRLRKRAPKLERVGDEVRVREDRARAPPPQGGRAPQPARRARRSRAQDLAPRPMVTIAALLGAGDPARSSSAPRT